MNGPHFLSCLVLSLALIAAQGDRSWPPGHVFGTPAAARSASLPELERFYVGAWVCPPARLTDSTHIAEYGGVGLNLMFPGLEDEGWPADNLRRLDLAAAQGIKCIVWDNRFMRVDPALPETYATLDSIVADYRDHPGFLAYYFVDEPRQPSFPDLRQFADLIRARDPNHPIFNNLSGRSGFHSHDEWIAHHREYVDVVHPAVLCNDHYEFLTTGDRHQFIENVSGLGAIAREAGLPFWSFLQLIEHGAFRRIGMGELAWQVSILLAYGGRGVGYFTYWTPRPDSTIGWGEAVIDYDGQRTSWYAPLARFDRLVRAAGETTARLVWLAAVHAGSLPPTGTWFVPNDWVIAVEGRATLGYFSDSTGVPYVLVANSDSLASRTITLTLTNTARACVLDEAHDSWATAICTPISAGRDLALPLEPGGFALVRLEGPGVGGVAGGNAPGLLVSPNPARGEVRIAIRDAGHDARLEIVDAGGRRAWSRRIAPGQSANLWHGERDSGGRAPAGLYFARIEDERGIAVTRIVWLGAN